MRYGMAIDVGTLARMLTQGEQHWVIRLGLPADARVVGTDYQIEQNCVRLVFESATWDSECADSTLHEGALPYRHVSFCGVEAESIEQIVLEQLSV